MANGLFTAKKVLNIEFSRRSSCYLLKSNFSIARPINETSTCEVLNFFLNSVNLITLTNSTRIAALQRYMQENKSRSFEVYCIILSAHFVKKKNQTFTILHLGFFRTHVFTTEIESFALRHRLKIGRWREIARFSGYLVANAVKTLEALNSKI